MDVIEANWEWILLAISIISLLALVATVIALPWILARLPADYFNQPQRRSWRDATQYAWLNVLVVIGKNCLGAILVTLGVVMLVTPGQGLLTLFAGLMLMDFPGKYRLERKLATSPGALKAINWVRKHGGSPPMEAPRPFD